MKNLKRLLLAGICLISILSAPVMAEKKLIFLDGYLGWENSLPPYMSENHEEIENLPFSGFSIVGNVFTSYVMSADPIRNNVTYERVWNEVKSLENVFQVKTDNFLRINLDFPGDFWDDAAWQITTRNFAAVAKASKNIGFKGVLFDDEAYSGGQHIFANYMSNFKFPKRADVQANPEQYEQWEIDESLSNRGDWIDYKCRINGVVEENSERCSYRNPDYSFIEHMDKVASRFKDIMEAMQAEFSDISVLILHGPATAHGKTNFHGHYIKPNSLFVANEYKGAMFSGLQQGRAGNASLHDFGEFYTYNTDAHFQNAYQWRKFDIASQQYNQDLDNAYRWVIPVNDRADWSDDVGVSFMISDFDQPFNARGGYDTTGQCTPADVESRFMKAFDHTDKYVMFYNDSDLSSCEDDIRWLDIAVAPVKSSWLNMLQRVYDSIQAGLTVSSISANTITENSAMIFWDVSDYATGQVEYGETTAYGNFNIKETSFDYKHHGQKLRNLQAGTLYHYRVISEDAQGNEVVSGDHSFTTLGDSVPDAATLVTPSGDITDSTPIYTWNAVSNSSWYYLWVNDSTGNKVKKWFTATQAGCSNGQVTCSVEPVTGLASGMGKWWIQTWNNNGFGAWSAAQLFNVTSDNPATPSVATLISPTGNINDNTPLYTWNAVSASTWYYLWVDDSSGNIIKQWFSAEQAGCANGEDTCSVGSEIAVNNVGQWWVQTWNNVGFGLWSRQVSFSIQ